MESTDIDTIEASDLPDKSIGETTAFVVADGKIPIAVMEAYIASLAGALLGGNARLTSAGIYIEDTGSAAQARWHKIILTENPGTGTLQLAVDQTAQTLPE